MLFQPLFTHAQQNPQDVAIIDDKGQYTYQQLAAAAAGLGMYLGVQTAKPNVGLLLPYGNLQSDVDAAIEAADLQHRHRFLGVIPLFHAFGLTAGLLAPVQLGSTVVFLSRFSPVAMVNAIRDHQLSIVFGVPAMFGAVAHLKSATPEDFKSIYAMISGGDALPA